VVPVRHVCLGVVQHYPAGRDQLPVASSQLLA